jgi:hypothetical protein
MAASSMRIPFALLPLAFGCSAVAPRGDDGAARTTSSDPEALAKQLSNPISELVSYPFQLNYDENVGPGEGERWTLNMQPVVPFALDEGWNVISRTILPVIDQEDIPAGEDEFGLGDMTQSFFFSPRKPTGDGWIWGLGPIFLVPTGTDDTLGTEKWGLGPTGVALKQHGPWTYGALVNHVWSLLGDDDRADVNSTFVQPFVSYTTRGAITFTLNSESTYDWHEDELAMPVNGIVSKVFHLGGQLVSIGGGVRYWVEESDASPEGLGFRFAFTLLFPK